MQIPAGVLCEETRVVTRLFWIVDARDFQKDKEGLLGMISKRILATLLGGFLLTGVAEEQDYPYLDDVNEQADGPKVTGGFPKIMASETQSDDANAEQWSKYDLLGTKTGMMYRVEAAQAINPKLGELFHHALIFAGKMGHYGYFCAQPGSSMRGIINSAAIYIRDPGG